MKNADIYQNVHKNLMAQQVKRKVLADIKAHEDILIGRTACSVIALTLVTMHDKFGFGRKRLDLLLDELTKGFQSIDININDSAKGCSFDDLMNVCKEEFGIDLTDCSMWGDVK